MEGRGKAVSHGGGGRQLLGQPGTGGPELMVMGRDGGWVSLQRGIVREPTTAPRCRKLPTRRAEVKPLQRN